MRASLPPVLCVLALCCLCSVLGNITNELKEKTARDVLDVSVPTVRKQEGTNPSGHSALKQKGMKETPGYKLHGKRSGSLATKFDGSDGKETHHVEISAQQSETSGQMNQKLGLPREQTRLSDARDQVLKSPNERTSFSGAEQRILAIANERTAPISEDDQVLDSSSEMLSQPRVSEFPCPEAEAIAPCICYFDGHNVDLDCSAVESEEQLANVFQQEFPVKELRGFNMSSNDAIRVLDNILNGITFTIIELVPGPFALQAISDYFFLSTKETLRHIEIDDSQLTSSEFPFAILGEMTEIEYLGIEESQLTWIPKILLPSAEDIHFVYGLTDSIINGTFPIQAGSAAIRLYDNEIEFVEPGSFFFMDENSKNSTEYLEIGVAGNLLKVLEAGTVPMRNSPMFINFNGNQIFFIAPGAFVMPEQTDQLSINLEIAFNQLTTIDEEIFGELMPFVTVFYIYDNPLTCGCDIAWLITNEEYMKAVDSAASCVDGRNLNNLDPNTYAELCF